MGETGQVGEGRQAARVCGSFGEKNGLDAVTLDQLKRYLVACLNRRRLRNSKDVQYDKELGKIDRYQGFVQQDTSKFTEEGEGRGEHLSLAGTG